MIKRAGGRRLRRLASVSVSFAALVVPLTTLAASPDTSSAATTNQVGSVNPVSSLEALIGTLEQDVACLPHILTPSVPTGCPGL
jgi:hypothetical protein